jgi:hypothetical protein
VTTSGVATFNLDLNEAVEEAFERCGAELRTGYDLRTARRSLNLLFADWANRGVNLWTVAQDTIPLTQGDNTYNLPNDTVDLLEHVIRTGAGNVSTQVDLTITRISSAPTHPSRTSSSRPARFRSGSTDKHPHQPSPSGPRLTRLGSISSSTGISGAFRTPVLGGRTRRTSPSGSSRAWSPGWRITSR